MAVLELPDLSTKTVLFCFGAALLLTGCARSPEQQYSKFLDRAKAQLQKRDYARAAVELQNCIRINPKGAEARYQLALAQLGQRDIRSAVANLWKTLQLDPKYTDAELKLSELALGTRDPKEAQEVEKRVRKLLEDSPASAEALNVLATAEWRLGKSDEAEKILLQSSAQFPKDLGSSVSLANLKIAQKDLAGAEAVLKKAAADNPASPEAAVALGQFYARTARFPEAEQELQQALRLDSKHGQALTLLADLQWRLGHNDQADQLYKKAADLNDPRYKPLHAIFLLRSGKRDQAITEFEQLLKAAPQDRDARTRLVAAYRLSDRSSDADKLLSAALQKNRKDSEALLQRSEIYMSSGKYAEAQADLNTVLKFRPDSGVAHYLLARVYQKNGSPERYREQVTEAVKQQPAYIPARTALAEAYIANKSPKAALQLLDQTPEVQKNDLPVVLARNWAYLADNNWAEARKGVDAILSRAKVPEALTQDGVLKMIQRNFRAAQDSFEAALKQAPDDYKTLHLLLQTYEYNRQQAAGVERIRQYGAQRPTSAPVQFFLGQVMAQNGHPEEARKAFVAAKAADPSLTDADVALATLDADSRLNSPAKTLTPTGATKPPL